MGKRTISVFYDGSFYNFKWLKVLLWSRDEFHRHGVAIDFISPAQYLPFEAGRDSLSGALARKRFDALFVAHHHSHFRGLGTLPPDDLAAVLKALKDRSNVLVWLDTADSTGTCQFDVLPIVDLYFKKQILKERSRYFSPIWAGRTFCEYYHSRYGVPDPQLSELEYQPLNAAYAHKIKVAWNVGAGDIFAPNKYRAYLRPQVYGLPTFVDPRASRSFAAHFRGSAWSTAAGWQRAKTRELLLRRDDLTHPDVGTKVSHAEYIAEIRHSRTVISPFGWGEICTRDFEAFAYGATLLKPSVEHMETFPNWYRAWDTYVPIDWDFEDFDHVLDGVRRRSDEYVRIAEAGQALYKNFLLGADGKKDLVVHVLTNLGWL
ncbi:hypothetical protein C1S82_28260 [Mycolicibacterium cosmeticum]|uniref:Glycosyltransferase family 1 protein n=1 Tax=Mycolicibacterium cosmeticum TaxID=258533 RepID=W9AVQ2_MYCCO|nr:hypothetical protein [Mycolicibacterium cosmeticum]TLH67473.1 hypothetical protein C1S82_28260 [Mycolicibacterium cosmeticum]CDO06997.1 hypothetical protein BN977_01795 [Mycolicibacterium cosmeticum]